MQCNGHGKQQANGQRDVFGPFIQFESIAVQLQAIELLFYFNAVSGPLLHAVIKACQMLPHRPRVGERLCPFRKFFIQISSGCKTLMCRRHDACSCTFDGDSFRPKADAAVTSKLHCDYVYVFSLNQGLGATYSTTGRPVVY